MPRDTVEDLHNLKDVHVMKINPIPNVTLASFINFTGTAIPCQQHPF